MGPWEKLLKAKWTCEKKNRDKYIVNGVEDYTSNRGYTNSTFETVYSLNFQAIKGWVFYSCTHLQNK